MNITNIRIFPTDGTTARKAAVGIVIDNAIAFHGLGIVENSNGELFVSLPAQKNPDTGRYEDVYYHTVSAETKAELSKQILDAWEKMKENPDQTSFDMGDPSAEMKLSSIRIREGKDDLPDMASAILDGEFVLRRIRIRQDRETGAFRVFMPGRKTRDGSYKDVYHPISAEARKALSDVILAAYQAEKDKETSAAE